jgi:hypothetical protein
MEVGSRLDKKSIPILLTLTLVFSYQLTQAQLLDKLKLCAKEKDFETLEVAYSSTAYNKDKGHSDDEEVIINSSQEFYTNYVVKDLYNKDGQLVQTSFFDAEAIAMCTEQAGQKNSIYHDHKGYIYAYYDQTAGYKKVNLLPASSMGFMTAGLTTQVFKLPQGPYFEDFEALSEKDIALNFLVLEMAFVYKLDHFENGHNYRLQNVPCFQMSANTFITMTPNMRKLYSV